MLKEMTGEEGIAREDIKANVVSVNHFTWLTSADYKNIDLFPLYKQFCEKHKDGYDNGRVDKNWMNKIL